MFRGYSVGAVDYLFKPFNADVLLSKVAIFVELYTSREALKTQAEASSAAGPKRTGPSCSSGRRPRASRPRR